MTPGQEESAAHGDDALSAEPAESDIEAWALAERRRRQAWLAGPTEDEKAAWARRQKDRRVSERARFPVPLPSGDTTRAMQRYLREMQLATEGAFSLLFKMSMSDALEALVQAGREWEDEFTTQAPRRRRVRLDADVEGTLPSVQTRVPHPPEGPSVSSS